MACTEIVRIFVMLLAWSSTDLSAFEDLQPADFESDWLLMVSQNASHNFREVSHGLEEVPIKVKVLIKPTRGPYEGWIFEGSSSQQADDDLEWLYCGILYLYNDSHVLLFAPKRSNKYDSGRSLCVDPLSWTSGSNSSEFLQVEEDILVKVMAWKCSSFPVPDHVTDWLSVVAKGNPRFIEVPHNLSDELSLVILQIRCSLADTNQTFFAEGTGAGSKPPTSEIPRIKMTGLLYAYDTNTIKVWAPSRGFAAVLGVSDGFGKNVGDCKAGDFRITGWKSLGQNREEFSFRLNASNKADLPDMSTLQMNMKYWHPMTSYLSVQVKALDGPNNGSIFPAQGQVHRNAYPGTTYGGVIFAYSANSIRIFVPVDETGTIIHIPDNWGISQYNQMSNNVEIIVKIWTTGVNSLCSNNTFINGIFSRYGRINCSHNEWIRCSTLCLSQPHCTGLVPCTTNDLCQLMDLNTYNNKLMTGELAIEGALYFKTLTC